MTDSALILLCTTILWTAFGVALLAIVSSQLNRVEAKLDKLNEVMQNVQVLEVPNRKQFDERMQALKDGTDG